jgi:hypothetical protein
MSHDPYQFVNTQFRSTTGSDAGFEALLAVKPYVVDDVTWGGFFSRFPVIRQFQQITLNLFLASLRGEVNPELSDRFLRDLPSSFGRSFHERLHQAVLTLPLFFRTDEGIPGKITEIQCPGSGWGEYVLLLDQLKESGNSGVSFERIPDLALGFNDQASRVVGGQAIIQHMTDNASCPQSNAYFINRSRYSPNPPLYWSFDKGVRPLECNMIRTHLFLELITENFFSLRLPMAIEKRLWFDYPPNTIFEQKLGLALPFLPETRQYYSEEIRSLFPHTTLIRREGIQLEDGSALTIQRFCSLPRRERPYFIKYAGCDPSRNWGSRAVYYAGDFTSNRLSNLIDSILSDYEHGGGCWILQRAASMETNWEIFGGSGLVELMKGYFKISGFYGPYSFLGASAMLRGMRKVHGQPDTSFALVSGK